MGEEKKLSNMDKLKARILTVMEEQKANGILETNTGVLKEKLKEKSRGGIRRAMRMLAKDGKVIIGKEVHGKRKRYTYKLAE